MQIKNKLIDIAVHVAMPIVGAVITIILAIFDIKAAVDYIADKNMEETNEL